MGIITLGGQLIPPPAGGNVADMNSIAENMYLYGPIHFISPFLAHAVGTLVGAYLVARFPLSLNLYWLCSLGGSSYWAVS